MYLDNIAVSYDLKPEIRINAEGYALRIPLNLSGNNSRHFYVTFNEKEFLSIYYEKAAMKRSKRCLYFLL